MTTVPTLSQFESVTMKDGEVPEFPLPTHFHADCSIGRGLVRSVAYIAIGGPDGSIRVCKTVDADFVEVPTFWVRDSTIDSLLSKCERQSIDFLGSFSREGCDKIQLVRVIKHHIHVHLVGDRKVVSMEHGLLCMLIEPVRHSDEC